MKKPTRSDFGWTRLRGWKSSDDIDRWSSALYEWENQPRSAGGRPRSSVRKIHESWIEILKHFDSSNPQRSQNAFCRWGNLNPASFSSWKVKPLRDDLERFILEWVAIFKDDE